MESEKRSVINLSSSKNESAGSQTERKLTNQDFRVLLMTPRNIKAHAPTGAPSTPINNKSKYKKSNLPKPKPMNPILKTLKDSVEKTTTPSTQYRDRAKERREGITQDALEIQKHTLPENQNMNLISKVAIGDTAEIGEEVDKMKYLTVDIEKAPIVKGLDYSLLKKVKLENTQVQLEEIGKTVELNSKPDVGDSSELKFTSLLARNIYNKIFERPKSINCDLFYPRRMAYIFCLDDDNPDSIIPSTLIRSKIEVSPLEKRNSISSSDIVIKKLAHILSYLRHGRNNKKVVDKSDLTATSVAASVSSTPSVANVDISIYDDVGVYDPTEALNKYTLEKSKAVKKGLYFEKTNNEEYELNKKAPFSATALITAATASTASTAANPESLVSLLTETDKTTVQNLANQAREKKIKMLNAIPESYAECYPEAQEMIDATIDSEDESDFTKMDSGKKKSSINRWDFDNEEDYAQYMDNKEAMPKAAFQYGLKAKDGRKTRRQQQEKAKAKLDRQFETISKMILKRSGQKESDAKSASASKKKRT